MKKMKQFFGRFSKPEKVNPVLDEPIVRYESEQKPGVCPGCGAPTIARIQYGLPMFSDELTEKIKNKEIVLGGCIVTPSNPSWQCTSCKVEIHRSAYST